MGSAGDVRELTFHRKEERKDAAYEKWREDNHIRSIMDVYAWMARRVEFDHFYFYPNAELAESYRFFTRFLDEMPVTAEAADELREAIPLFRDLGYYEDDLVEAFNSLTGMLTHAMA